MRDSAKTKKELNQLNKMIKNAEKEARGVFPQTLFQKQLKPIRKSTNTNFKRVLKIKQKNIKNI